MAASTQDIQHKLAVTKLHILFDKLKTSPIRKIFPEKDFRVAQTWLVVPSSLPDYLPLKQFYFLLANYSRNSKSIFKRLNHVVFVESFLKNLPSICHEFLIKNQPNVASSSYQLSDSLKRKLMMHMLLQCIKIIIHSYSREKLEKINVNGDLISMLIQMLDICHVNDSIIELIDLVKKEQDNKLLSIEIFSNICCYYEFFINSHLENKYKNLFTTKTIVNLMIFTLLNYELSRKTIYAIYNISCMLLREMLYAKDNIIFKKIELLKLLCFEKIDIDKFCEWNKIEKYILMIVTMDENESSVILEKMLLALNEKDRENMIDGLLSYHLFLKSNNSTIIFANFYKVFMLLKSISEKQVALKDCFDSLLIKSIRLNAHHIVELLSNNIIYDDYSYNIINNFIYEVYNFCFIKKQFYIIEQILNINMFDKHNSDLFNCIHKNVKDPILRKLAMELYLIRKSSFDTKVLMLLLQSDSLLTFLIRLYGQEKSQKDFFTMLLTIDLSRKEQHRALSDFYQLYQWCHANVDTTTLLNQIISTLWLPCEGTSTAQMQVADFPDAVYALAMEAWASITVALADVHASRLNAMANHSEALRYPYDLDMLRQTLEARAAEAEEKASNHDKSKPLWLVDAPLNHARFFLSEMIIESEQRRIERFKTHLLILLTQEYSMPHALLMFIHRNIDIMPEEALKEKIEYISSTLISFFHVNHAIFYYNNHNQLIDMLSLIIRTNSWVLLEKVIYFLNCTDVTICQKDIQPLLYLLDFSEVTPDLFIKLKRLAPQFTMNQRYGEHESWWHLLVAVGRSDILLAILATMYRPYIHQSYTLMKLAIWRDEIPVIVALLETYQHAGSRYLLGRPQGDNPVSGINKDLLHDLMITAIERTQENTVEALLHHYGKAYIKAPIALLNMAICQRNPIIAQLILSHTSPDIITKSRGIDVFPAEKAIEMGRLDILKLLYQHFLKSPADVAPTTSPAVASSSQCDIPMPLVKPLEIFIYQAYEQRDYAQTLIHLAINERQLDILRWFIEELGVKIKSMDVIEHGFFLYTISSKMLVEDRNKLHKILAYLLQFSKNFDIDTAVTMYRQAIPTTPISYNFCMVYQLFDSALSVLQDWSNTSHMSNDRFIQAINTLEQVRNVPMLAIELAIAEKLVVKKKSILKYLASSAYAKHLNDIQEDIKLQRDTINHFLLHHLHYQDSILAVLKRPVIVNTSSSETALSLPAQLAKVINNLIDFSGLQEKPLMDAELYNLGYDSSVKPVIHLCRTLQLWLLALSNAVEDADTLNTSAEVNIKAKLQDDAEIFVWVQTLAIHIAYYVQAFYLGQDEATRDSLIEAAIKCRDITPSVASNLTTREALPASSAPKNDERPSKLCRTLFKRDKQTMAVNIYGAMFHNPITIPVSGLDQNRTASLESTPSGSELTT